MQINKHSLLRVVLFSIVLGLLSFSSYGQTWGVVEKSNEITTIGNQQYYIHTIAKGNTFYSLARVYGVTAEEIKAANPEKVIDLKLGSVVLIPVAPGANQELLNQTLSSFDDFFYHVVKNGESIYSISKIYSVDAEEIRRVNGLSSNVISPGLHLKIPETRTEENQQSNTYQQRQENKDRYFEHIVQSKETLFSIAKRYGIGLETLKYINNFTNNAIYPGQSVLVPRILKNWQDAESKAYIIHIVQPKEGVFGIARKYGVTISQIQNINPELTKILSINQEIKIPRMPNKKGYIEHLVSNKRERLTDIAREYDISVRNLKALNPDVRSKLKRGETLNIPLDFIDKETNLDFAGTAVEKQPETQAKDFSETRVYKRNKTFHVALLLPLYLNEVDSLLGLDPQEIASERNKINAFRFLEFYEGAQIAVDSMRQMGMQLDFHVYDVTDDELELALLLQDRDLGSMDLMISLLFSKSFAMVSEFSKEHRIPLINVLSKRRQIVFENPYVFKISPKPASLYNRIADFVGENLSDYNTIIVRNNPYQLNTEYDYLASLLQDKVKKKSALSNAFVLQKMETYMEGRQETFLDTLRHELIKGDYSFDLNDILDRPFDTTWVNNSLKTVIYSQDSLGGIMENASLFRNNLIVALGSDQVFAIELFTKLNYVRDSLSIKVIGLPDWHEFKSLDVDYSQPFSLRVVAEDFVDYRDKNIDNFIHKFHTAYHKVPEIESYSFLGYDATFYFLQAIYNYGDNWLKSITDFEIPLMQNQLHFEKQSRGGYENTYWNLYRQENYNYILER